MTKSLWMVASACHRVIQLSAGSQRVWLIMFGKVCVTNSQQLQLFVAICWAKKEVASINIQPAGRQNHIQFWNSLRLLSKLIVQISIMCFYILKKCIKCTVPFIYIPLVMKYKSFTIKWQGESESRLAVERDKLQIFIENLTCIWSIIVV